MRCTGYCSAAAYNVPALFQALGKRGPVQLYRDALHFQDKEDRRVWGDGFFFAYGVVVFWGFSKEEEKDFLLLLKEFEVDSIVTAEDEFTFAYGDAVKIDADEILLHNKNILTKFAISHGIAQSVKLTIFEESLEKTFDKTKKIPEELARCGNISLPRKEISQKMGELFIERSYINLRTEIFDVPEFFWEHPELEPFFRRTAHYLDVSKRTEALNRRLNVLHELFDILRNELNHQYSSRLEWTIIILIVIEVMLAVMRDIFHIV